MSRHAPMLCSGLAAAVLCASAPAAELECLIEPSQIAEIRAPVEGMLRQVRVDRGDTVAKGQVVAVLESGPEHAAHDVARYRAEMEGLVRQAEARVEYAARKAERLRDLARRNFVSPQAADEADTERQLAEAALREAKENRRLAELEQKRAHEVLNQRTVRSPLSGVVVERHHWPGEIAVADAPKPIVKVATIDPLRVEIIAPVSMYGAMRTGMTAEIVPEIETLGTLTARVVLVDKVIDAASGTFGIRLHLPNPKGRIPAGIKCRARFPVGGKP